MLRNTKVSSLNNLLAKYGHLNWALLDQALVSGANFLTGVLLVRLLGVDQYGVFVLLWMVVQFGMSIQNAMVVSPMQSITPKLNPDESVAYLSSTLTLQIGVIVLMAGMALLVSFLPAHWLPDWWSNGFLAPLVTCMALFQLQDYLRRSFFVRQLARQAFYIDLIAYGGQLLLLVTLLYAAPSFDNALWLIALSFAISIGIGSLLVERKPFAPVKVVLSTTARHWISSRWLLGSAILQWLSGNYFLITAGVLLGPAALGAIRAAQNLLGVTHIAFQGLENIVPGRASRVLNSQGNPGLQRYVYKVLVALLVFTGITALFMASFAELIFNAVYGHLDNNSRTAMFWYVPIYMLVAACLPYRAGLRSIEKTRAIFIAYVLGTVFAISTANYLVSGYAVDGVMFGMLFVQIIMIAVLAVSFIQGLRNK